LLFLITFFIGRNFCKLLFTGEKGKVCYFFYFFTAHEFRKLLFTGIGGPGFIFYSLKDGGEGCTLIFFLDIFYY